MTSLLVGNLCRVLLRLASVVGCVLVVSIPAVSLATTLSVGPTLSIAPIYLPSLPTGTFLVPITVSGAVGLQTWQFSLSFDDTVVEEVDPFDGSAGIYGARFTPDDPDSQSFILGGFPLNGLGLVDTIAGFYPGLVDGVTGDGTLAFVLFARLSGQDGSDPGFAIVGGDPGQSTVPEPDTVLLLAGAGVLLGMARRHKTTAHRRRTERGESPCLQ